MAGVMVPLVDSGAIRSQSAKVFPTANRLILSRDVAGNKTTQVKIEGDLHRIFTTFAQCRDAREIWATFDGFCRESNIAGNVHRLAPLSRHVEASRSRS